MKRIINFLVALSVIFSGFGIAYAEDSAVGARESEILKGLKIYDTAAISPTVTRADFVLSVARLMGVDESTLAAPQKQVFADVATDHPRAAVIDYLFNRGIMIGYGDASFKPDSNVTCREAAKILVSVLGYKELAEADGGYYKGYLSAASNAGMLKGVKTKDTDEIDTGNLAVMIVNTMEADMMTVKITSDGTEISSDAGTTLMAKYLHVGKYTGILTGYEETSIESASKAYGTGNAEIGGVEFSAGDVNLDDLIGMNVEVYYYDDNGDYVIKYAAEKKNKYFVADSDNIESADLTKIEYYKDSDSTKTSDFKLGTDTVYIYNGKKLAIVTKEDLLPTLGSIKMIDNDNDSVADVVIINEYEEYVVSGVISTDEKVNTKYDKGTLDFSSDYNIKYYAGEEIADFGSINKNCILNVASSKNTEGTKLVKVYITEDSISGEVSSVEHDDDEHYVTVDGEEYKLSKGLVSLVGKGKLAFPKTGNSYLFKLNVSGEIAEVSMVTEGKKYAYVIKSWVDEDSERTYIKMYTSDGDFIKNPTAEKVTLNGQKVQSIGVDTALMPYQLIIYDMNNEGEISKIKTAEDRTAENWSVVKDDEFALIQTTMKSDGTYAGLRFYKNFAENRPCYFVDNQTVYFQIPADKSKEDDYKIVKKLGSTDIAARGPVYIYDVGDGGAIGAMVAGELGGSEEYNTPQMVDRITTALNEDDEECTQITFVDGSSVVLSSNVKFVQPAASDSKGKINWTSRIDYSAVTAKDLKRGDVIQCKVVDGYAENIMVLVCVNNIGPVRIDGDHIAKSGNMLGQVLSVNDAGSRAIIYYVDRFGDKRYQAMNIGGSVFKYDSSTGKADYSTASDVQPGDTVLLNSFWWSIKATFIFR